jgi:hypothetical protein
MVNFQNNRKILYNEIPKDYKKLKNNVLSLEQFIAIWFKDENIFSEGKINLFKYLNDNVDKMFTKKSNTRLALKSKRTFYRTFACDLEWAKKYDFCVGDGESNVNLDDNIKKSLMGNYVSKTNGEFKIFESTSYTNVDEPIQLGISSYSFSYVSGTLDNPRYEGQNLTFDISIDTSREDITSRIKSLVPNLDLTKFKSKITFDKDRKSFSYNFLDKIKGTATKTEEDSSNKSDSTSKTDTTSKTDSTKKSDDEKPYKPNQTTIYSTTTDYNKIDEPNLTIKNCNSFPFELGCKNSLIGDLNQKFFGNRRQDTYTKLLQNRLDNRAYFSIDNEEKMITKEIWDQIMRSSEKSKIVKETVKKVLKEHINKKK